MASDNRGSASGENNIITEPFTRHVFIIGAKCIGQYGGYETFLDKLTEVHADEPSIKYHIVTKANGDGAMDESKLSGVSDVQTDEKGTVRSFTYHNADVVKLDVPQIGPAQAIAYDVKAFKWCLRYIDEHKITAPIIYVLACRIGPFFGPLVSKAHKLGCKVFVNPDGRDDIIEETGRKASKIRLRDTIVSYPEHKYTLPSIPVLTAKPAYVMPRSFTAA